MKKLAVLFLLSVVLMSGCDKSSEETERTALTEEKIEELVGANDLFTDMRFESEYEWYNDFIYPLKENNWKVSKEEIDETLKLIDEKKQVVASINPEDIKMYIDYKYNDLTAEIGEEDDKLKAEMEEDADSVRDTLSAMKEILDIIETDVKYGLDENIDGTEIQNIENSYSEILKIYDARIK